MEQPFPLQQPPLINQCVQAHTGLFVNLAAWEPTAPGGDLYLQSLAQMWHEQQWYLQQQQVAMDADEPSSPAASSLAAMEASSSTSSHPEQLHAFMPQQHVPNSKKLRGLRAQSRSRAQKSASAGKEPVQLDLGLEAFPALGGAVPKAVPVPKWGKPASPTKSLRPTAAEWLPAATPVATGGQSASGAQPVTPQLRADAPAWGV